MFYYTRPGCRKVGISWTKVWADNFPRQNTFTGRQKSINYSPPPQFYNRKNPPSLPSLLSLDHFEKFLLLTKTKKKYNFISVWFFLPYDDIKKIHIPWKKYIISIIKMLWFKARFNEKILPQIYVNNYCNLNHSLKQRVKNQFLSSMEEFPIFGLSQEHSLSLLYSDSWRFTIEEEIRIE